MYKLRIYKLSGADKGNLDHEEFFETKEEMDARYKEYKKVVRNKLERWECHAYFPTAWKMADEEWCRLEGF